MAGQRVLVDTGPLVALMNKRDRHHQISPSSGLRTATTCKCCRNQRFTLLLTATDSDLIHGIVDAPMRPCAEFMREPQLKVFKIRPTIHEPATGD